jgi:hypothetical protein
MFEQAAAAATQAPLHSFMVAGQVPPQVPWVHVAVPPIGTGQAVHDIPQLLVAVSLTHLSLHRW